MKYDKTISVLKEELFQESKGKSLYNKKIEIKNIFFQIFKECGTYDIRLERQLSLMRRH